jgi:hypothetical protein
MAKVAVVHLVRKANGTAPLERFLASYRKHPAGIDHDVVIVFKGFSGLKLTSDYQSALEGLSYKALHLADRGFDLAPYFATVRRYEYERFCFLNSFSRIAADGWLEKLHCRATQAGVGVVGATGSYQSFARGHDERGAELRRLRPYARLQWRVRHILSDPAPRMVAQRAAAWALGAVGLWKPSRHFPPFPNYHVRTNAFVASREVLLRIHVQPIVFKLSAFMIESGRNGLTRQIMAMGLRPLIVDRHGRSYEKEEWHVANVFRQSRQEDLMIEDNQTDAYSRAGDEQRAWLSRMAWGQYARPA